MTTQPSGGQPRRRIDPARRRLGLAVLMVVIGSFMPWLSTGVGPISGARGPGLWTFYSSLIGLGGVLLPPVRVAAVQAGLMGVVCVGLPVWQLARAVDLLGLSGWTPGPGVVMVFAGGVLALISGHQLWRRNAATAR